MKIIVERNLILSGLSKKMQGLLIDRMTIDNPQYIDNLKQGRWNGNTPEKLKYYTITEDGSMILPRGFACQLIYLCRKHRERFTIDDKRRMLTNVDFQFKGELRPYQEAAVKDMLQHDFGTLASPTGSGKTCMALAIIARRRQPSLIIVHTRELLNQWQDRIEFFLGIDKDRIGVIGGGKFQIGDRITVATVQTLVKRAGEVAPHIGNVIVDECHRTPSRTFTEAVSAFDSKYALGLSATLFRRDKLSKLIFWHIGDTHHQVDKSRLIANGDILHADVITRETDFRPYSDPTTEYSRMLSELTEDAGRNRMIAEDVAQEAAKGNGICLVLSDRKSHCRTLQEILEGKHGIESELLTGDTSPKMRRSIVDRLNNGEVKVLVATGQLIGEGFDARELSTLFLATPIKFSGRVLQYLGRVLRPAPGKDKALVFDYVDINVGPLRASARSRQRVYEAA